MYFLMTKVDVPFIRYGRDSADCFRWEDIIQKVDTPDLKQYEKFVLDWHDFLIDIQEVFYHTEDETLIKNLNMYVLSRFYYTPFEETEAFYPQFYQRLEAAKELLKLEI